jgi:hypothetical protein
MAKTSFNNVIPSKTLEKALNIGKTIVDCNGGNPIDKLTLAESIKLSPTSSSFIQMVSSSQMYGLTSGTVFSETISLTELGKNYFYPRSPEEKEEALIKALLFPPLLKKIYNHFDKNKLPQFDIAQNILIRTFEIKNKKTKDAWKIIVNNAKYGNILQEIKGVNWINLKKTLQQIPQDSKEKVEEDLIEEIEEKVEEKKIVEKVEEKQEIKNQKVFISHGKNKDIVSQLKEIITFGKFTPIIAEEHETTSKPVPEKVLEDMRSCFAGIIHIEEEEKLLDNEGETHCKLNENVLIEIGAAMALYKNNMILLVQKGIALPSNLQGLYRCEYEGNKLSHEATMKLLKSFNEFK